MTPAAIAKLHLLGTGAAYTRAPLTTTMLAVADGRSSLVVDCGGDVVQRLLAADLDPQSIRMLLLTHGHIDHVGGLPLMMRKLSLDQRSAPLPICGPEATLAHVRELLSLYDTAQWKHDFARTWHPIPLANRQLAHLDDTWEVYASPTEHSAPGISIRITHIPSQSSIAYSSDTSPTPQLTELASGVDILVHEATGPFEGHSTARQAAEAARNAKAQRLVLVHMINPLAPHELETARRIFPETEAGREMGSYRMRPVNCTLIR